jgi:hypothetical protein
MALSTLMFDDEFPSPIRRACNQAEVPPTWMVTLLHMSATLPFTLENAVYLM